MLPQAFRPIRNKATSLPQGSPVPARRTQDAADESGASNGLGWPRVWLGRAAVPRNLLVAWFLGVMLLVRVLADDRSASNSRYSGSLNLSGIVAVVLIVVAAGMLFRRRRGVLPTALAVLGVAAWTAVAVGTRGASSETLREGVREVSVIALAVIVLNDREALTVAVATRLVQLVALVPGLLALYQLATHTGMDVAGHIRSHGTLAHPNSAAMFFAIAAIASLWRYLDNGRHRPDALLSALFAAALVATFSIDGLITLVVMLIALGALRPPTRPLRLVPFATAGLVVLAFFATPLGSQRITSESSTGFSTAESEKPGSTFTWRLHKWKTLLPEWERSPVIGRGLGTTTNVEGRSASEFTGALPHNEYLRYLVETGVIGLALLLLALALMVRRLVGMWRTSGAPASDTRNAATLAIALVVGCLVNALADNTFLNSPTCYVAAIVIVSVLALARIASPPGPTQQAA